MIWLVPVAAVAAVGVALAVGSGRSAKRRLKDVVKVSVLGVEQGGGLFFELDDLPAAREAGYERAAELGFDDGSMSAIVLDALARDIDSRIGTKATLRGVRLGRFGDDEWAEILTRAAEVFGTWGEMKAAIDDGMSREGLL